MRPRLLVIPAVLMLAACSAPADDPTPTAAEPTTQAPAELTEEPTEEATTEPTTEPTVDPTAPPELCVADDHVGPVWEALKSADLPSTAMITDVEEFPPSDPSKDTTVVQVTVCSIPVNNDETREIASLLAAAAEGYDGPGIYRMDVTIERPRNGQLEETWHLYVEDFGSIVWDRPPEETSTFWREV